MIQSYSPIQSVNQAVSEIIGPEMPPAVHIAIRCMRLYHEFWWIGQKLIVYRDPNRWIYLCAGYVLNQTLGRYETVKKAFQIYTISLRVYELYLEIHLLKKAWDEFCWAIKDQYPVLETTVVWEQPKNIYLDHIKRIIWCTKALMEALGNVSSRCIEVHNAFYMTNNHEIVIDVIKGIHLFKKQEKSLQVVMIKITRIITPLITDTIKADEVIESIDDLFAKSTKISNLIEGVKENTGILIDKLFEGYSNATNAFSSYTNPEPPPKHSKLEHLQVAK